MADLTVFPIHNIPNNYDRNGKKIMIHDLTQPESTSTKLIDFTNLNTLEVTYTELTNLINNNLLVQGTMYLLTDFQTIYDQLDFDNAGILKPNLITKTGSIEQIWLLALSTNIISSTAYSKTFPKDRIQYDYTYSQTPNGSIAKGRISERVDEWNNRTDYDHRVIKFLRYDDGTGLYSSFKDNGNAVKEFLTFGDSYATNTGELISDNYLENFYNISQAIGQEYSNNVFQGNITLKNVLNAITYNNSFSGQVNSNTFSGNVYYNIFNDVGGNSFSGQVNSNIFSDSIGGNIFSGSVGGNIFSYQVRNNSFSGQVNSNTFSGNVNNNTFSGDVNYNTFSEYVNYNTFSGYVNSNTFSGSLIHIIQQGNINNKTLTISLYPNLLGGSIHKKELFTAITGDVYFRYFDGINDFNTLIV